MSGVRRYNLKPVRNLTATEPEPAPPAYVAPPDPAEAETRSVRPPSWIDGFGPARDEEDFNRNNRALSTLDIVNVLDWSRCGVVSVMVFQGLLYSLWLAADIVPGFVLYDGAPNRLQAFTHGGWWRIIEFWILIYGAGAVWFGISFNHGKIVRKNWGKVELRVKPTLDSLKAYRWITLLGGVSHLIHFVFSFFEYPGRPSTLTAQYEWCFWSLIVLLFFEILLCGYQLSRIGAYMHHLYYAAGYHAEIFELDFSATTMADYSETVPSTPKVNDVESQIADARYQRHGLRAK